jgi:D-galactonate transporter
MEALKLEYVGAIDPKVEESAYSKVTWRLVPYLFVCYIFCFLDRVNVGFAKLQMQQELGFSDTVYGFAAGIFFIGYFVFEIPSNLLLQKVGPRRWIARIMITWGIVSALTMYAKSPESFYVYRFLLGILEAGFFPGIILYLTYWYPAHRRVRITALFMTAIPLSGVIGGPLSGWILDTFSGASGLSGWQWLFLIEGVPSVILGVATLWYLDDRIAASKWLREEEKQLLEHYISQENKTKTRHSLRHALLEWKVWVFALTYFCFTAGVYAMSFWLPQMIKSTGVKSALAVGLLTALPCAFAAVGMVLIGGHSDRTLERRWHIFIVSVVGAMGVVISATYPSSTWIAVLAACAGWLGAASLVSLFWSVPTAILTGTAAAAGIALVNSMGNLSGFVAPYMLGYIKDATHSLSLGLYFLAGVVVLGGILVLAFGPHRPK